MANANRCINIDKRHITKTAILNLRVSTDGQVLERLLIKKSPGYAKLIALQRFAEDYSARAFKRPEWIRLLTYLRKHRSDLKASIGDKKPSRDNFIGMLICDKYGYRNNDETKNYLKNKALQ